MKIHMGRLAAGPRRVYCWKSVSQTSSLMSKWADLILLHIYSLLRILLQMRTSLFWKDLGCKMVRSGPTKDSLLHPLQKRYGQTWCYHPSICSSQPPTPSRYYPQTWACLDPWYPMADCRQTPWTEAGLFETVLLLDQPGRELRGSAPDWLGIEVFYQELIPEAQRRLRMDTLLCQLWRHLCRR